MNLLHRFFKEEEGMQTVELIIILVALVAIALMLSGFLKDIVSEKLEQLKGTINSGTAPETTE